MKKISSLIGLALLLLLSACGNESFESISLKKVNELSQGGVQVIDVRTPEEFAEGHVPKSINIPLDTIGDNLAQFKVYDSFILICRSGNRSSQASELLANNEIKGFYNAYDGMQNWSYEVEVGN